MITSQDIERKFAEASLRTNEAINVAQYEFYKPDLMRAAQLMAAKFRQIRDMNKPTPTEEQPNPLAGLL